MIVIIQNCFRPNANNKGSSNTYHIGKKIKEKDLEGCERDNNPSIGAFESPDGYQNYPEPTDAPDTDIPDNSYDVKIKLIIVLNRNIKN